MTFSAMEDVSDLNEVSYDISESSHSGPEHGGGIDMSNPDRIQLQASLFL